MKTLFEIKWVDDSTKARRCTKWIHTHKHTRILDSTQILFGLTDLLPPFVYMYAYTEFLLPYENSVCLPIKLRNVNSFAFRARICAKA